VYLDTIEARVRQPFVAESGAAVPSGTAEARAHAPLARSVPIVDAGGVLRDLSCVAVPIGVGPGQYVAVSALYTGPRPPDELLTLTRMTALRITGLLRSPQPTPTRDSLSRIATR
jgi:hypothetical protein